MVTYRVGGYWIGAGSGEYTVYMDGVTRATVNAQYPLTPEGLLQAMARVDALHQQDRLRGSLTPRAPATQQAGPNLLPAAGPAAIRT